MFAIPGLVALIFFVYVRPQEIFPGLRAVPFLYLFCGLTVVGWLIDVRLKVARLSLSTVGVWSILFSGWGVVTLLAMAPTVLVSEGLLTAIGLFLLLAVSQSVQTLRGVRTVAMVLVGLSLMLAAVAIHQATAPRGCVSEHPEEKAAMVPDGRPCQVANDCYEGDLSGSNYYRCERVGLIGTTTIEGRVRYRGILQDPNELALVLSAMLPFAFALYQTRATFPRLLLAVLTTLTVAATVVLTKSRSGQLAFSGAMGIYFIHRFKLWGVLAAAVAAIPVLILGWRGGEGAEESSAERLEYWLEGFEMVRGSPVFGVGKGQFTEYHHQTAHNSFMLSLAERGLVGMFLYTSLIYTAIKGALAAALLRVGPEGHEARTWGLAVFASLAGITAGSFFLSFTDHHVLWIYLGLAGGLVHAIARHKPDFRVNYGPKDGLAVVALCFALIVMLRLYIRVAGIG
jgi:hypothetical protein